VAKNFARKGFLRRIEEVDQEKRVEEKERREESRGNGPR
jgi:hypothetical protein